jgi:transcriptional regulator with PAS, ATPase and Fis domain
MTTRFGRASMPDPVLIGPGETMQRVLGAAARVAAGNAKVLVTGESGVGKDLVARFVHARSTRADRPFIALNCAGLSEHLLETELFGHVKGSFTGAHRDKVGKLQLAHQGTVFLDEVGEMSLRMQAILLRFLENGEIQQVGSDSIAARVDVRVVTATNRDLGQMVAAREFREDLLYRIRVVHLHIPPLRERREDIPALVEHLLARGGYRYTVSDAAMELLQRYSWPGNVRELQNVLEQLTSVGTEGAITADQLPLPLSLTSAGAVKQSRERRRQVADELYHALVDGTYVFWNHVHTLFMNRDITRNDLRGLVRRGLAETGGNYRALLKLFGMGRGDYKRFLNFLAAHDCSVDFREFRPTFPANANRPPPTSPPAAVLTDTASGR